MHAFDVLGDPVRRRVLDLLAERSEQDGAPLAAGDLAATISVEFGISQPAVSQHLRVLRDNGFVTVVVAGQRRLYSVDPTPMIEIDSWLARYRAFWPRRLDALETELHRGRRARARTVPTTTEET